MWWIIVALAFAGLLFILIEFLFVPGVGVAGFFGIACLIGACVYAFLEISRTAGFIVTAVVLVLVSVLTVIALREKTWKRFELETEVTSKVNTEVERVKVGDRAKAQTRLAPMGNIRFEKFSCEAKSFDNTMIDAGTDVEVVAVEDNKIFVKTINQ